MGRFLILLVSTALWVGCKGSNSTTKKNTPVVRQGSTIQPVSLKYFDGRTAFSQDGKITIFLSGKDGQNTLKGSIVLTDDLQTRIPVGIDPQLGSFQKASLTPDGSWAAWLYENEGTQGIAIQKSNVPTSLVSIDTLELARVDHIDVMKGIAGSALLYDGQDIDGKSQFVVTGLTEASDKITIGTANKISGLSEWEENIRWLPTESGLATVSRIRTTDSSQMVIRTFTDSSLAGMASKVIDLKAVQDATEFVTGKDLIAYIGRSSGTTTSRERIPYGNKPADDQGNDTKGKVYVDSEVHLVKVSDGSDTTLVSEQYKIRAVHISPDAAAGVVLGNEVFACDIGDIYGTSMIVFDPATQTKIRFLPHKQEDGTWSATTDLCAGLKIDPPNGRQAIDIYLEEAKIAKNAEGHYVVVYSSWYNNDLEVFRLEFTWDQTAGTIADITVSNISNNSEAL